MCVSAGGQHCCVFPPQSPKSCPNPGPGTEHGEPVFLQSKGNNSSNNNTLKHTQRHTHTHTQSAQSVRKVRNCRCGSVVRNGFSAWRQQQQQQHRTEPYSLARLHSSRHLRLTLSISVARLGSAVIPWCVQLFSVYLALSASSLHSCFCLRSVARTRPTSATQQQQHFHLHTHTYAEKGVSLQRVCMCIRERERARVCVCCVPGKLITLIWSAASFSFQLRPAFDITNRLAIRTLTAHRISPCNSL